MSPATARSAGYTSRRRLRTMCPWPVSLVGLALFQLWVVAVVAQPAMAPFTDCFSGNDSQKMTVSTVYAQILEDPSAGRQLNLTLLGSTDQEIDGISDDSGTNLGELHNQRAHDLKMLNSTLSDALYHDFHLNFRNMDVQRLSLQLTTRAYSKRTNDQWHQLCSTRRTMGTFHLRTSQLEPRTYDPHHLCPSRRPFRKRNIMRRCYYNAYTA